MRAAKLERPAEVFPLVIGALGAFACGPSRISGRTTLSTRRGPPQLRLLQEYANGLQLHIPCASMNSGSSLLKWSYTGEMPIIQKYMVLASLETG